MAEYAVTTHHLADGGAHITVDGPAGRVQDLVLLVGGTAAGVYEVLVPEVRP